VARGVQPNKPAVKLNKKVKAFVWNRTIFKPEDKDTPSVFNRVAEPPASEIQKDLEDMFEVKTSKPAGN
jgi:hypothetical protein